MLQAVSPTCHDLIAGDQSHLGESAVTWSKQDVALAEVCPVQEARTIGPA